MAKKTKVATLKKKRTKAKPLCWVDRQGNVRHRKGGRKKGKGSVLVKKAVPANVLKERKSGKIVLFLRGKVGKTLSVWKVKNGVLVGRKKRRRKKAKKRRKMTLKRKGKRRGRRRKVGRPRLSARKRKSRRCPKSRKSRYGSLRAMMRCVAAGKGKTLAKKKVYNSCLRKLRKSKSKKVKAWLRKKKRTLAKV